MIYVVELEYYDTNAFAVSTAYYATEGFVSRPADTPAHTYFAPRVINPALIRRDIFDVGTTGGASRIGYGELVLDNTDGALDVFNTWAVDGRSLKIRVLADADAAYPAAAVMLFTGTMEQAEVTETTVKVRIRDRQLITTSAFQPNKYAGTNALPNGTDGLVSDLKGKPKPRVLGAVFNIEPVPVNTSRLIYQVNDGAIRDVMALYDSGALLSRSFPDFDYATEAAMFAAAPTAGTYRVWKDGGMLRLGSSPVGQLTADVLQGATPASRTAAAMWQTVLTAAGISTSDISAADYAALNLATRATLGFYYRDETTLQGVLDDIARSVGAWWASDVRGMMRMQRLLEPDGTPVLVCNDANILEGSLQRVPLTDGGLPAYRTIVRGVRNYTVQTTGLVGIVGAARRARLAQPWQDAVADRSWVRDAYLLASELTVETGLQCLTAVDEEAQRLASLYGVKRDRFELQLRADMSTLALIDLGVVVELQWARFGLDNGKLFRVIGYQLDPTTATISLTVWG